MPHCCRNSSSRRQQQTTVSLAIRITVETICIAKIYRIFRWPKALTVHAGMRWPFDSNINRFKIFGLIYSIGCDSHIDSPNGRFVTLVPANRPNVKVAQTTLSFLVRCARSEDGPRTSFTLSLSSPLRIALRVSKFVDFFAEFVLHVFVIYYRDTAMAAMTQARALFLCTTHRQEYALSFASVLLILM